MGLLWPHLEKLCWVVKNAKFLNLGIWQKWKNGQNLAIFGQNGSRFCTPAESSQNGPLSFSDQKNLFTNQTAGGHFVFLPKTCFFEFGAPCAAPKQNFFPKMVSKVALNIFRKSQTLIASLVYWKNWENSILKVAAESTPLPARDL